MTQRQSTILIIPCYHSFLRTASFLPRHARLSPSGFRFFSPPPLGVLFSFPSRYQYTIGLEMYLGLGVDASHIHAGYPTDDTQVTNQNPQTLTFTGLSPSTARHSSQISTSHKRTNIRTYKHHIYPQLLTGIQFVLNRFRSPLLTVSHIAFFSSAYQDVSIRQVPAPDGAPPNKLEIGRPIRQPWVQRMHAPRPGISLLAATFIST
eukprot:TRINITY_DN60_c0_g1_i8.p7 TRINITY_DN60_c0_g1~~TRINITY_DN60_c0_g1_i8.p7  ORF type:complete len:206 (-),score=-32.15 TRINITY_DN60_c0_g1_i8:1377-1994(-)